MSENKAIYEQNLLHKVEKLLNLNNISESKKLLSLIPENEQNNFMFNYLSAKIYKNSQQTEQVLKFAEKALNFLNQDIDILYINQLADIFYSYKKYEEALKCLTIALDIKPDHFDTLYNAGMVSKHLRHYSRALNYFSAAAKLNRNEPTLNNLAELLSLFAKTNEAEDILNECISINPENYLTLSRLALIKVHQGKLDEAEKIIYKALSINEKDPFLYYCLCDIKKFSTTDIVIIEKLESLLPTLTDDYAKINALFALGKMYDDIKNYDKAFIYYKSANDLKSKTYSYDIKAFYRDVERNKKIFTKDFLKKNILQRSQSKLPVFIVGMPRSGTSLTEQILCCHSLVTGVGEVTHIGSLANKVPPKKIPGGFLGDAVYPESLLFTKPDEIKDIANKYIDLVNISKEHTNKIVNKMPANFANLGFINLLFPNSTIIHCKRHPLDVVLSIYFHDFVVVEYSYKFEQIVAYYKIYHNVMKYWHQQIPGKILDVYYEELINKQEEISRQMISFLGLKWEDSCLNFHKNKREVYTASTWQVRQRLYSSSMLRHKKYEKFIGQLRNALSQEIAEYEAELQKRLPGIEL